MQPPSAQPARVAYVDHASDIGGAEKSMLDIIERLNRERYEPLLFCAEDAEWLEGADLDGVGIDRLFKPGGILTRSRDEIGDAAVYGDPDVREALKLAGALYRRFRYWRPEIVHTNTLKAHMIGGAAAWLSRRRLVWHLRDILDEGNALDWLLKAARRCRPKIIAISNAVRDSLRGADVDVSVIHNGTDLTAFHPRDSRAETRRELGLDETHVAICAVGRLTPWKGHRELLRGFASAAGQVPNARLIVVGDCAFWEDSYDSELKSLAASLGVAELVNWLGFRRDVPEILAACDVFALVSVDEPFGRVFVEAMASELPAIGTRTGGVPEIVVDGEIGRLVEPGDIGALASAIVTLCRDGDVRRRMGKAGRARAMDEFNVDRTADRVQAVYEELLDGSRC